ncbi:basic phospholipase A2 caudoxin-like [Actinia tenebrosa]|uniref:Phospholipase A2 n=1 Tax=Actinia tenebrosa TaxID=6105 RepID=A0A6P8J0E5_ACTTE|nr:basic phospholipase A2 caudoxin-like [Actinia tenebrosa]
MFYKTALLLVAVTAFLLTEVQGHRKKFVESKKAVRPEVQKKNLLQFGLMVNCMTGRFALDYNNYGSYCGVGGSGTPVDDLDRCCKVHDECYGRYDHCTPYYIYYTSYRTGWHPNCKITCGDTDPCRKAVCMCDKEAAECFAKNKYNPKNNNKWFLWFRK